jgi:hypothetical protein
VETVDEIVGNLVEAGIKCANGNPTRRRKVSHEELD